jgi:hypothetical protein
MPYETGTANDVNDLLSKLRVFALAQGWAVDFNGARTDHTGQAVLLNKAGMRCGFFTRTNVSGQGATIDPGPYMGPALYPGPYNSGQAAHAQTGISYFAYANNMPGPFVAYHVFAGANRAGESYLHVVVEVTAGSFRHFGVGTLNRLGVVTNGSYAYGNRWHWNAINASDSINSTFNQVPWDSTEDANPFNLDGGLNSRGTIIRADSDSVSPRYCVLFGSSSGLGVNFARGFAVPPFFGRPSPTVNASALAIPAASGLTGRAMLAPLWVAILRPGNLWSPLGSPQDIRAVNMSNITPGAAITLGPDTWRVFPVIRKNGIGSQENSGVNGYAYRVAS